MANRNHNNNRWNPYFILSMVFYTLFLVFMVRYIFKSDSSSNNSVESFTSLSRQDLDPIVFDTMTPQLQSLRKQNLAKTQNFTTSTNSVIVILAQNKDLNKLRLTLREFEDRFNKKFHYPYVVLNDQPFTEEFKYYLSSQVSSKIEFGQIKEEHWSVPPFIDDSKLKKSIKKMKNEGVMYGEKMSYHHMCRYYSGFFMHHELVQKYEYYWRVEPDVHFFCDIDFDPFLFMKVNKKKYAFVIALKELQQTIPSLWKHTIDFAKDNKLKTKLLRFFTDKDDNYNLCHFWSNFEIGSFDFLRSKQYTDYFNHLDKTGNFFYERWGDAPVHSLALGLFLNHTEVHFFENIGYQHDNFFHCPNLKKEQNSKRCLCPNDKENFDDTYFSCLPNWRNYKDQSWDFE